MNKVETLIQLLGAGLSAKEAQKQSGCSRKLVYKTKRLHGEEIKAIKDKCPKAPPTPPNPKQPKAPIPINKTTVIINNPEPPPTPTLDIPELDPTKDPAEQLKALAWKMVAAGAAGAPMSKTQKDMVNQIIKASEKNKVPPPTNRKLIFKVDLIDVVGDEFKMIQEQVYEVKV